MNRELNSRYRLLRSICAKQQTEIWLGRDLWLDEEVVFKVLGGPRAESVRAEFRLLSRLSHPNLVGVRDLIEDDQYGVLLVQTYAPGPDLLSWASSHTTTELIDATAAVVRGLLYVHALGAVHRDIKSENIRVGAGQIGDLPAVRILDFGLASARPRAEIAGTRGYIAPEVLAGEPAQPASDIYSLGALLLQALSSQGSLDARHSEPSESLDRARALGGAEAVFAEVISDLLQPDPDSRPDAAALLETLGTVAGKRVQISNAELAAEYFPRPPLVGRGDHLARFEQIMKEACSGQIQRVQLQGPGKSRLAYEVCVLARLAGLQVVSAASIETLLRSLDLDRRVKRLSADNLAARVVDAISDPSEKVERTRLLCLDGLPESRFVTALAAQLGRLAPRRGGAGLFVIWAGGLPDSKPDACWERVELGPLSAEQVHKLARGMLYHVRGALPWIDDLHGATNGDPRMVVNLIRAQIEAGLPEALVDSPDLAQLNEQRLAALDPDERRLVGIIASAPRPVPSRVLAHVAPDALSSIGTLLARGLVLLSDEGFAPHSTAIRLAARALVEEQHATLHRRFAAAWAAEDPVDAATLGHHLVCADRAAEAVTWLLRAPLPDEADLLRASELLAAESPARIEVLVALAHAARGREDLAAALAIVAQLGEQDASRAVLLEAELLLDAGQPARALTAMASITRLDSAQVPLVRARAQVLMGHFAEAAQAARAGLDLQELSSQQRAQLQNVLGIALDYQGSSDEGLAVLQRAERVARQLDEPNLLARVLNSKGIALQHLGQLEESSHAHRECVTLFRQLGDLRLSATCALNLGTLAQRRMQLEAALEHYRQAAALSERADIDHTSAWAAANEANLLLLFGETRRAWSRLEEALKWARAEGSRALIGHVLLYQVEACRSDGRLDEALELLRQACSQFDPSDKHAANAADLIGCEVYLDRDEQSEASRVAHRLLERMTAADPDRWQAHLLAGKTALAMVPPACDAAVQHLEAALEAPQVVSSGERAWEVHASLAEAYRRIERHDLAQRASQRCREALSDLRRRIPAASRQRFDERPDVRAALASLGRSVDRVPPPSGLLRVLELNKELNRSVSPDQLLPQLLDAAIELTGSERGFILLGTSNRLRLAASRNVDGDPVKRPMTNISRSIARDAIARDTSIVVTDATDDERFYQQVSVRGLKLRAVLCVPLRSRGEVLGVLYLDNRFQSGVFGSSTVALAEAFADQAGIALESARLLEETATQREHLAHAKAEVETLNRKLELQLAQKSQQLSEMSTRLRHQEEELVRRYGAAQLVGESRPMRRLYLQMDRVKETDLPVFISGESGTGKELVARAIHYTGPRHEEPFVAVNCGAIPASLLESELFGHVKGAFTGAELDRPGVFEIAKAGTLLLDEVTDMDPAMQVKLLRVLQEGTFRRLGDQNERQSHCRVLSASNKPLQQAVNAGRFREDLYYRLNVISLDVPALRNRRDDLSLLIKHFLAAQGVPQLQVSPAAMTALLDHDWPGNVRQLENELSRAAVLADGSIDLADLSTELRGSAETIAGPLTLHDAVRDYERRVIVGALEQAEHNVSLAAEKLGVHRVLLHRKMKAFGIKRKSHARAS